MRFTFLTPGTGHFYCGSCLRDNALAGALRRAGHEVTMVPLYLPLMLEDGEETAAAPVRMGGINMYLQQKSRLAARLPRFIADLLDRPGLLRWASRRGSMTDAHKLGAMTLSMLKGEHGRQNAEVAKLAAWAAAAARPDVVVLSNLLLAGVVRRLKEALGRPLVATVQGEAPFLDALPEPYASRSWTELAERVRDIDVLVPVSRSYGEVVAGKLGAADLPLQVVHNGVDLHHYPDDPVPLAQRSPPTIGYLARMCRDKGLPTLVEAFTRLVSRGRIEGLRLAVCGVMLDEDRALVGQLRRQLGQAGCAGAAEFHANLELREKLDRLRTFSVLSVPATYGESFGLYLLEAMASGVPVVQPRHGAFPEILEATGGGELCEPDDPTALAEALERLLLDPRRSQQLADSGRRAVLERFHSDRMAQEFAALCAELCARS